MNDFPLEIPERVESEVIEGEIVSSSDINLSIAGLTEPVWERQISLGESRRHYSSFLVYAEISPGERSIRRAWELYSKRGTKQSGAFTALSYKYYWAERAAAWDIHKLKDQRETWLGRDEARRNEDYIVGSMIRKLAQEKLATMTADDLTPLMVIKYLELASKLQGDAIPNLNLEQDDITNLFRVLPEDRRERIVGILIAKIND